MRIPELISRLSWTIRLGCWQNAVWQRLYVAGTKLLRPGLYRYCVHTDTEVVIEGYPRSANTFLVHALEIAAGPTIRIAHHLHDPCQIGMASRWGIPCFVIIRDPLDAIVSWKLKTPALDFELLLRLYRSFYEYAERHASKVTFLNYQDLIAHPDDAVRLIVDRLGPPHNSRPVHVDAAAVFASIDDRKRQRAEDPAARFDLSVARPSAAKEALKGRLAEEVRATAPGLLAESAAIYQRLLAQCVDVGTSADARHPGT